MPDTRCNYKVVTGHYGEMRVQGSTVGGFKSWALSFTEPEPEEETIVAMRTAVVTASHVMLFPRGLEKAALDPSLKADSLGEIGPFDVTLYPTLQAKADGAATTIEGCLAEPSAMTAGENPGALAAATFMGLHVPRQREEPRCAN